MARTTIRTDDITATGTPSSSTYLRGDGAWGEIASAGFNSVQVFTSSGTWTRPSGVTKVIMEVQGAGGSGSAHGSEPDYCNCGGYAKKFLDVSSISTSTITVGSGGAAVASGNNGNTGGNSSWADGTNTVTGNGGAGGQAAASNLGGTGTGGDLNISGGSAPYKEIGGASVFSPGPFKRYETSVTATPSYGGGGMGAYQTSSGAGADGILIVWEYK